MYSNSQYLNPQVSKSSVSGIRKS